MDTIQLIAANVRRMREGRRWSQHELAKRAGFHRMTITKLELCDNQGCHTSTLDRLCKAFDVPVVTFFWPYPSSERE